MKPPGIWDYDCVVIGNGPGGLVSALYLRRFRRKTLLVADGEPRAAWAPKILNLVGYERGISGKNLLKKIERQLLEFGGVPRANGQASVRRIKHGFEVLIGKRKFRTPKVILATGIRDKQPELPNLTRLRRLGLLRYCSICDAYESRDLPVGVLANGPDGLAKAEFIVNWTKKIRVLIPPDMEVSAKRTTELKRKGVRLLRCTRGFKLEPCATGHGVRVIVPGRKDFVCSVVYVELGCEVNSSAFGNLKKLRKSKEGFLITTQEQRTSIPGLFAVGDCVNLLGQVSVAAGQAAVAATTIHNDLL